MGVPSGYEVFKLLGDWGKGRKAYHFVLICCLLLTVFYTVHCFFLKKCNEITAVVNFLP